MRAYVAASLVIFAAGSAAADACYSRTYSDQHMAKNPDQNVQVLSISFHTDGALTAAVSARFRGDDATYRNTFGCAEPPWVDEGVWLCTDGNFFMTKGYGSRSMLVYTDGGFIVHGPEGAEPRWVIDEDTTESIFKLFEATATTCEE